MNNDEPKDLTLMRETQILELIPVSRSTFRRWVKSGKFPPGMKITERIRVWHRYLVLAWIKDFLMREGVGQW